MSLFKKVAIKNKIAIRNYCNTEAEEGGGADMSTEIDRRRQRDYMRSWRANGKIGNRKDQPNLYYQREKTDLERFLEKIRFEPSGCWVWIASLYPEGYGQFWCGTEI